MDLVRETQWVKFAEVSFFVFHMSGLSIVITFVVYGTKSVLFVNTLTIIWA